MYITARDKPRSMYIASLLSQSSKSSFSKTLSSLGDTKLISGFTDFFNQNMYWVGEKKEKKRLILHIHASLHTMKLNA